MEVKPRDARWCPNVSLASQVPRWIRRDDLVGRCPFARCGLILELDAAEVLTLLDLAKGDLSVIELQLIEVLAKAQCDGHDGFWRRVILESESLLQRLRGEHYPPAGDDAEWAEFLESLLTSDDSDDPAGGGVA